MTPTKEKTFGSKAFGAAVSPLSFVKPGAVFPGAVATDSDMTIAVNRQQTRLALPLNTTDTSMTVVDPSVIVAYCLLTIDTETVKVTGAPAGNVIPIARGFDGTAAAVHLASAIVSGFIDAYHHNRLVAEVEAIELALGANLSNIASISQIVSTTFKFPAQTPGGSLIAGNNSINLSPVPKGVNGSDQNHYLYVSGGTGTAEAVLITGGSAVSGAASGTLIIQCANTHSGAWTIQSATAGISEAISSLAGTPNKILIPAGSHQIYAPINVSMSGLNLSGSGRINTQLVTSMTGGPLISAPNAADQITITDMQLTGPGTGSNFAISLVNQSSPVLERVTIAAFASGISVTGNTSTQLGIFREVIMNAITGDGVYINTTIDGGTWENTLIGGKAGAGANAFHVVATVGMRIKYCYANGVGQGLYVSPAAGQVAAVIQMWDAYFDGFDASSTAGFRLSPAPGATINSIELNLGGAAGFITGALIDGSGTVQDVSITGAIFYGNKNAGIGQFGGTATIKNVFLTDLFVEGNSTTTPGAIPGLNIQNASNVIVRGGVYAAGSYGGGANSQSYGIVVGGSTTNVQISDLIAAPNVAGAIGFGGSNPGLVIRNVVGYNPVGVSTITVGASPFIYTAGSSPETIFVQGGTITTITRGGLVIANATSPVGQSVSIPLAPNTAIVVTYTAAPTMFRDVQ